MATPPISKLLSNQSKNKCITGIKQLLTDIRQFSNNQKIEIKKIVTTELMTYELSNTQKTINDLKMKVKELEQQINYIKGITSEALDLKYYEKLLIDKHIKRNIQRYKPTFTVCKHFKFVTITFDPAKFGINNNTEAEKQYILHKLAAIVKMDMVTLLYGCFEFQNNGAIHAHVLMGTNYDIEIYRALKKAFTDNPRNNKAIDMRYARATAPDYINKDDTKQKEYFELKPFNLEIEEDRYIQLTQETRPISELNPLDM